jgi:hypothetical protein
MSTIINYDDIFNKYETSSTSNINNVLELLKIFQNYLDSIYLTVKEFRNLKFLRDSSYVSVKGTSQINYDFIIGTLKKYMNIIYNYYNKIQLSELSNNIDINYHFVDTMTTAIIILYSYIYFYNISDINEHKNETYFKNNHSTLTFIMQRIIKHCYTILDVPANDELLFKFKDIIYNNEPLCRKFINNQTRDISDFIQKIRKFNHIKPSNERYITIPKYTGICWFISFIVGISYSDKNKNLIIQKSADNRINYKPTEDISILSSKEIFITLIYTIIENITSSKKTYDKINESEMNELNIYLKETPIKFLIKLISEYYYNDDKKDYPLEYSFIKKYIEKNNKEIIDNDIIEKIKIYNSKIINADKNEIANIIKEIIKLNNEYPYTIDDFNKLFDNYSDLYYLYYDEAKITENSSTSKKDDIFSINKYKPLSIDQFEKFDIFGIYKYEYFFLNILYKLLNIDSLYLLKCEDNKLYSYDIYLHKDPDIILINSSSRYFCNLFKKLHVDQNNKSVLFEDITEVLEYTPDIITYNNNKYEIDYILYGSDLYNSWNNTGHAIVALKYDNEDYFYDSRYYINEYTYKNKKLRYPCPLLRKDWNEDFKLSSAKFCIKKCFYTEIDHTSKLYKDAKHLTEDNICYTANNDIICCYVKIKEDEIKKGGEEKLKSTHKKINFVINNKKIHRTIYINNNGIEFIKYNNKFIKIKSN